MGELGDRFNEGKPKWSLVHFASLIPMIRVLEFGAKKYGTILVDELENTLNELWQKRLEYVQNVEEQRELLQKDCVIPVISKLKLEYVRDAKKLNQFYQEDCAIIVTTNTSRVLIASTNKDRLITQRIGEEIIQNLQKNQIEKNGKKKDQIQIIQTKEVNVTINQNMESLQKKLIEGKMNLVNYVESLVTPCTLIITIQLENSEVYFVVNATTAWDSLMILLNYLKELFNIYIDPDDYFKLGRDNWKKGLDLKEILESMQRHLAALMDGEENDPESKLHHIGHIMCNAMFYVFHMNKNKFGS